MRITPRRRNCSGALSVQAGGSTPWLFVALLVLVTLIFGRPWLFPGSMQLSLAELEAKYATADSRFADLDGVRVHYMDQGEGPAVVLLHASFMNLRSWDLLAESLKKSHRVVRLDFLASGLTGPELNDNYSFDRNLELVDQLTRYLGIDEFALVATSSGGIVGFNYAARYPERISRLLLVNSAGLPRSAATDPNRARGNPIGAWLARRYQSRGMVRDTLDLNFIEPHEPPDWLVDMSYDMRLREGLAREGALLMANFRTGDPQTVLAGVTVPTMILWGIDNQTVSQLEANVFQNWLTNAPTVLKKYPDVGHYLYLEIPTQFATDVSAFLAGHFDAQLGTWQRVPYEPGTTDLRWE